MNNNINKNKIDKLLHLLWEADGCCECIHFTTIRNKCGTYPDCDIDWCKNGEKFDIE